MPQDPAKCGRRILLVGGDGAAHSGFVRHLAGCIAVDTAATGQAAIDRLEGTRFDMLVIDLPLPDIDGTELCRGLRQRGFPAPIVLLSGSRAEDDAIRGLDAGANDFIVKPYHPGLMLARLRAHLRQFERSDDAVLEIGRHVLDCGRRCLTEYGTGRRIGLTAKEVALLRYLYWNRGRPVRLAAIMRDVWGHRSDLETHTAETHIYRLRQKIEPDPAHPQLLVRCAGGYQLIDGDAAAPLTGGDRQPGGGTRRGPALCLALAILAGAAIAGAGISAQPRAAILRPPALVQGRANRRPHTTSPAFAGPARWSASGRAAPAGEPRLA